MNAVEIEQAITDLAEQPFDPAGFPYDFLAAFGNKETTLKRLRAGVSNKSDLGGVLQTNHIHILTCDVGQVAAALKSLRESSATTKAKAKFILATDGTDFEAEDLASGETVACAFKDFPDHFGFFLPLAGISTVRQISENAFDIRATSRLNRLYVELLKVNPDWGKAERRHDMNHFMARLIFCFFAEDTNIFVGKGRFTETVSQMSAKDSSNTHEVIGTLFLAMNTKREDHAAAGIPRWAENFPYVNGGLFSGNMDVPKFSKMARSYLLHVGGLDWTKINPDIFGSMIQAVAEDEERGELGMHYTSVPNILKVLNPLFLDDLKGKLEEAGTNARSLLNLRRRISKIRVFDPACGSGNFLVIAYKAMREIEAEINKRRGEADRSSEIPLTNFRGIELRDFPAEIARLALVIADFQCDVTYRGHKLALAEFLPLSDENWITCGNALRLDWLSVCPPTNTSPKAKADDLSGTTLEGMSIDSDNGNGETYICGNPPYLGSRAQTKAQKEDLQYVAGAHTDKHGVLDYVSGWFIKACEFGQATSRTFSCAAAFVATNSICQGQQVPVLWPIVLATGHEIIFAHTGFKWANLASHNAGVTVVVVAISRHNNRLRRLFSTLDNGEALATEVANINPYLAPSRNVFVTASNVQIAGLEVLDRGSAPTDDGALFFDQARYENAISECPNITRLIKNAIGGANFIHGNERWILKLKKSDLANADIASFARPRLEKVAAFRAASKKKATQQFSDRPWDFPEDRHFTGRKLFVPQLMSEKRDYLTCGLLEDDCLVLAPHFQCAAKEIYVLALISSRLHAAWAEAVCGKLKTDVRYSNTLGWNTFPVPPLTDKNKSDLTRCAEDILLAREQHFPATIADLYDPDTMPADLRAAHDRNDEVIERIYIGRRFKNDTERLEKLFDLYTKMTAAAPKTNAKSRKAKATA
ncbi:MAG: DNA methyltransferase [Deltaproteobacteria bacterium]|nr:DNA methyltransferase [Deltaproteobacteria bacterium]